MHMFNNILELDPFEFNCGGFALGTFDYFHPIKGREANEVYKFGAEKSTSMMLDGIFSKVSGLRLINLSDYKLDTDETIILFRVASPYPDFHFMILYDDVYLHKTGSDPRIYVESRENAENPNLSWCNRYHGPIVALAKKVNWTLYEGVEEMIANKGWWD